MTKKINEIVFLGLGSNLGHRNLNMARAIESLKEISDIEKISGVYETEPFGVTEKQPKYLNQVLKIKTDLDPKDLIRKILAIERRIGRKPHKTGESRIIDIDILIYGLLQIKEHSQYCDLVIPHPRMHQRAFVLIPLLEISPNLRHPIMNIPLKNLLIGLDTSGIRLLEV